METATRSSLDADAGERTSRLKRMFQLIYRDRTSETVIYLYKTIHGPINGSINLNFGYMQSYISKRQ